MFRNYCRTIVVLAAIGIPARTDVDLAAQSRSAADLTGTWVLNAGLSDRPGQALATRAGPRAVGAAGRVAAECGVQVAAWGDSAAEEGDAVAMAATCRTAKT